VSTRDVDTTKAATPGRRSFLARVVGAALLDADTYEEVEADKSSIGQAALIVLLASIAATTGFWLRLETGHSLPPGSLPIGIQLCVIFIEPWVLWLIGSAFTYMVGSSFFRGPETETDYAEVLRTTGFGFVPGVFACLAFVPPSVLGLALLLLARLWMLTACIVAVRQALDFTTARALGTFGVAAGLLWLVLWGLSVTPVPL
jgi:hypothetical protein